MNLKQLDYLIKKKLIFILFLQKLIELRIHLV